MWKIRTRPGAARIAAVLATGAILAACNQQAPQQAEPVSPAESSSVTVRPVQEPVQVRVAPVQENGQVGQEQRTLSLEPATEAQERLDLTPAPK